MSSLPFQEDEKVLCYHGALLYEAKITDVNEEEPEDKYGVHYIKWSSRWDEYVPETRMLKLNEENLRKKAELEAEQKVKKVKRRTKEPSSSRPSTPTVTGSGGGSKKVDVAKTKEKVDVAKTKVTISEDVVVDDKHTLPPLPADAVGQPLPDALKQILVDDAELVKNQNKLHKLPIPESKLSVKSIITKYVEIKCSQTKSETMKTLITKFGSGLDAYFSFYLSKYLLYATETKQYQELLAKFGIKRLSEVYGGVHLLRLLVCLNMILQGADLRKEHLSVMQALTDDFIRYLTMTPSQSLFRLSVA